MNRFHLLIFALMMTVAAHAQFINNGAMVTIQSGATLRVETSFENQAGTITIDNGGILEVQGNFTNDAGAGTTISPSGKVRFIGTGNSDVTLNGDAINQVEMAKTTSTGKVTLLGNASINGNLEFTGTGNNKIELGNFDLSLATTSTVSAATDHTTNGYVVTGGTGRLRKSNLGTTPFTYPVGFDATTYNPITISENGTADTIGVRVLQHAYVNGASGTQINTEAVNATWAITESIPGNSNLNITAQWNATDELPSFTSNECGVGRYNGTTYDLLIADLGAASGAGPYTRSRSGVTPGNFIVGDDKALSYLSVNAKVFLHGPYGYSTNSSGVMSDDLRTLLPSTEPYTGYSDFTYLGRRSGETIDPARFTITDNTAVVDWVFLQLRNTTSPFNVIVTKSALLQKDGNIVDTDSGPVKFLGVPEGNYRIAIRHRNHLGVMTANNKTMNFGVPVSINFTNNTEPVEGGLTNLNYVSGGSNPAYVLIPGDGNSSGNVSASDNVTIWRPNNSQNVTSTNYLLNIGKADYNLSGTVSASDNVQMWRPNNSKFQAFSNN
jgi:hypothetical protein